VDEFAEPTTQSPADAAGAASGGDSPTSDFIEAFQWRADDNLVALRFRSGLVRGFSGDASFAAHAKDFAMVEVHPWRRNVFFKTTRGDGFSSTFGSRFNSSPVHDRPVVYLDQNQWSTLSKSVNAPWRVRSDDELQAAWRLIGMASTGKVILPLSAAHLGETGSWGNDDGRYELAVTIMSCSGGWQMRDHFRFAQPSSVKSSPTPSASLWHQCLTCSRWSRMRLSTPQLETGLLGTRRLLRFLRNGDTPTRRRCRTSSTPQ